MAQNIFLLQYLFIEVSFYRNIFLSQYLYIIILCVKMCRVNKALGIELNDLRNVTPYLLTFVHVTEIYFGISHFCFVWSEEHSNYFSYSRSNSHHKRFLQKSLFKMIGLPNVLHFIIRELKTVTIGKKILIIQKKPYHFFPNTVLLLSNIRKLKD